MNYLITGGFGFLGSNLAEGVLKKGERLCVFDNLSRLGSSQNMEWLRLKGEFQFIHGDIRNGLDVENSVREFKPDVIFHLAGQVAMSTSISNPRRDFEINAQGTINLLETVRIYAPHCIVIYSSTNKVYGDLEQIRYEEHETRYVAPDYPNGFNEKLLLDFQSPYGCSKGAADQYMLDYARIFGLKTVVFRHSSMYGGRQFATYDQGWVGWFCQMGLEVKRKKLKKPITISGNGKQVRDVLYADDMVSLYFQGVDSIENVVGNAFNVGGGMQNSLSLLELIDMLEKELDIGIELTKLSPRKSDQKIFVADLTKVNNLIGWKPHTDKNSGIKKMMEWVASHPG